MARIIRAHFDGRFIVPDEPVDLPAGQPLAVELLTGGPPPNAAGAGAGAGTAGEERDAAIDRLLSRPIRGLNIPDSALSRESLYGDDE